MTLHGVDVSSYQGPIDFDVLATKVNFIYIRACYAKSPDPYLERNVTEAKRVGIPYGLYFFPLPVNQTAFKVQAQIHTDILKEYGSQLFPAWDLESDGGMDKNDTGNWMEKYAKWFLELSGIEKLEKIMTYTSAGWFNGQMPLTNTFWRTRLWLADWTPPPNAPYEWSNHSKPWVIWQTGIHKPATDYGCPPPPAAAHGIDVNTFYGDEAQFKALFGVEPHKTTDPLPPPLPDFVRVSVANANIRAAPKVEPLTDVGDLALGAKLPVTGQSGEWWEVGPLYVHKTVAKPE